jgi:SAM-dependent methyltransferase
MSVAQPNVQDMPHAVELAAGLGVGSVHFLWLFTRGKADHSLFVEPGRIEDTFKAAVSAGDEIGVTVDNAEILRSQVFSIPGSRFDLSNAGWESLAVAPDGGVYPSPALIDFEPAACGHLRDGLGHVWRTSPRLEELRRSSLVTDTDRRQRPLRFLVGGEDVDHSFSRGETFTGHDPYVSLYEEIALWLIAREADRFSGDGLPGYRLRMGDYLYECGAEGDGVFFTHSNCVLSLPGKDGYAFARDFYTRAAEEPAEHILNPVAYDTADIAHVPESARVRSYGCGSPVSLADLSPGETVVDLGCGAGMECFIAAEKVGPAGSVVGVDMLEPMLRRAREATEEVASRLGCRNVEFRKGYMEALPLASDSADVIVSNCVVNLCPHKRRVFAEMLRVLKPGGRLVISDVSSDTEIPLAIQYSEKLRGECLGGAFQIERLFELLRDIGFRHATLLNRFPYREAQGHPFQSTTYRAEKPSADARREYIYRGPFAAVVSEEGAVLERGVRVRTACGDGKAPVAQVLALDDEGNAENTEGAPCCCAPTAPQATVRNETKRPVDCMVCGAELRYLQTHNRMQCHYCGETAAANAVCANGHFVCDVCHSQDALAVIERICLRSPERDMTALLKRARRHRAIPVHGPEHHGLVPGVILAAYRSSGGQVTDDAIRTGIERGAMIPGGSCAFMGNCGAATGVAVAFSIILSADPLKAAPRRLMMKLTGRILENLSRFEAARCCQRDCWIALRVAAEISREMLPLPLVADEPLVCDQFSSNRECLGRDCPLWPRS